MTISVTDRDVLPAPASRLSAAFVADMRRPGVPAVLVAPTHEWVAFVHPDAPLRASDLARPSVDVAGVLLDARSRAPHVVRGRTVELLEWSSRRRHVVPAATFERVLPIGFSNDGGSLALADVGVDRTRLAVVNCQSGRVSIFPYALDASAAAIGERIGAWLNDTTVLCRVVPDTTARGSVPDFRPAVYDTGALASATRPSSRVFPGAEELADVEEYLTSQLAAIDVNTGAVRCIGVRALFARVVPSPRGTELLVARFGSLAAVFARAAAARDVRTEIWDLSTDFGHPSIVPRQDALGPDVARPDEYGVPGRWHWHPLDPATAVAIAQHAGRHVILALAGPFDGAPDVIAMTEHPVLRFAWLRDGSLVWLDADVAGDTVRLCVRPGGGETKILWSIPTTRRCDPAAWRVENPEQEGEWRPVWRHPGAADGLIAGLSGSLYLTSTVAGAAGPISVMDRWRLDNGDRETVFRSSAEGFERVLTVTDAGDRILTVSESRTEAPCCSVIAVSSASRDHIGGGWPRPACTAAVRRKEVRYVDAAGVQRRLQIYLPPGAASVAPHPFVVWIYPQINHADIGKWLHENQCLQVGRPSPTAIMFHGYGLCDYPDLPIFPLDANDPAAVVRQLVEGIGLVLDALVGSGLADPERLAIGGYSIGAYAALMLAAHTTTFRAVIACSGDYNLASRPLGSALTANRQLYEAPSLFLDRSPLLSVARVVAPVLVIHGERDRLVAPAASRELYAALARKGASARYVSLPYEDHLYAAEESRLVVQEEIVAWCDAHVGRRSGRNDAAC